MIRFIDLFSIWLPTWAGATPMGLLLAAFLVGSVHRADAQSYEVRSPDGAIAITLQVKGDQVTYAVSHDGQSVIEPSPVSMTLGDGTVLGQGPAVQDTKRRQVDRTLEPVVREKNAKVPSRFRELRVDFEKDFSLVVRAYNGGAAYRFETRRGDSLTVQSEEATFDLATDEAAPSFYWARGEHNFITHSESYYQPPLPPDSIGGRLSTTPLMASYGGEGPRVAVTEAALRDYPGMFVRGERTAPTEAVLRGTFASVPLATKIVNDDERNTFPSKRADYIARTSGTRSFPWRVVIVEESDADLIENQLVYKLSPELRLENTDWIEPGKVAWDWYNALNLTGVDFETGVNNQTYKYYIDFAAEHDLEFVILDEGWYELGDLMTVNDDIDVQELSTYAAERDVGLILWMVWSTLDKQMEEALDQFEEWDIRGIKVDFMQRDDQDVVQYMWRTARKAAEHELLVNYHGSYKPAGLRRAYPNVVTREGVNGLEQNKWSDKLTPEHNVTIPFTRMLVGPMDYTPGAMVNVQPEEFNARFERPMSQGTRAHQLGMYVVYESPQQMLADSPTEYEAEPIVMDFLADVPVVWDETRVLRADVGNDVVVARRHGNTWYLGAMSDEQVRTVEVTLSFLEEGTSYRLTSWSDGPNAHRHAEDFQKRTRSVSAGEALTIEMAPGGGYAARFRVERPGE